MSNDSIADLLTRIRNAQLAGHKMVLVRNTRVGKEILNVLKKEGFISSFVEHHVDSVSVGANHSDNNKVLNEKAKTKKERLHSEKQQLEVVLKYYASHDPAISSVKRISKSGRRQYFACDKLPKIARGLGICVVSTSKGIMSDREARKQKLGGEAIASVS